MPKPSGRSGRTRLPSHSGRACGDSVVVAAGTVVVVVVGGGWVVVEAGAVLVTVGSGPRVACGPVVIVAPAVEHAASQASPATATVVRIGER
jgi:hypothetical protein